MAESGNSDASIPRGRTVAPLHDGGCKTTPRARSRRKGTPKKVQVHPYPNYDDSIDRVVIDARQQADMLHGGDLLQPQRLYSAAPSPHSLESNRTSRQRSMTQNVTSHVSRDFDRIRVTDNLIHSVVTSKNVESRYHSTAKVPSNMQMVKVSPSQENITPVAHSSEVSIVTPINSSELIQGKGFQVFNVESLDAPLSTTDEPFDYTMKALREFENASKLHPMQTTGHGSHSPKQVESITTATIEKPGDANGNVAGKFDTPPNTVANTMEARQPATHTALENPYPVIDQAIAIPNQPDTSHVDTLWKTPTSMTPDPARSNKKEHSCHRIPRNSDAIDSTCKPANPQISNQAADVILHTTGVEDETERVASSDNVQRSVKTSLSTKEIGLFDNLLAVPENQPEATCDTTGNREQAETVDVASKVIIVTADEQEISEKGQQLILANQPSGDIFLTDLIQNVKKAFNEAESKSDYDKQTVVSPSGRSSSDVAIPNEMRSSFSVSSPGGAIAVRPESLHGITKPKKNDKIESTSDGQWYPETDEIQLVASYQYPTSDGETSSDKSDEVPTFSCHSPVDLNEACLLEYDNMCQDEDEYAENAQPCSEQPQVANAETPKNVSDVQSDRHESEKSFSLCYVNEDQEAAAQTEGIAENMDQIASWRDFCLRRSKTKAVDDRTTIPEEATVRETGSEKPEIRKAEQTSIDSDVRPDISLSPGNALLPAIFSPNKRKSLRIGYGLKNEFSNRDLIPKRRKLIKKVEKPARKRLNPPLTKNAKPVRFSKSSESFDEQSIFKTEKAKQSRIQQKTAMTSTSTITSSHDTSEYMAGGGQTVARDSLVLGLHCPPLKYRPCRWQKDIVP